MIHISPCSVSLIVFLDLYLLPLALCTLPLLTLIGNVFLMSLQVHQSLDWLCVAGRCSLSVTSTLSWCLCQGLSQHGCGGLSRKPRAQPARAASAGSGPGEPGTVLRRLCRWRCHTAARRPRQRGHCTPGTLLANAGTALRDGGREVLEAAESLLCVERPQQCACGQQEARCKAEAFRGADLMGDGRSSHVLAWNRLGCRAGGGGGHGGRGPARLGQ